jgi:hypothetical protein
MRLVTFEVQTVLGRFERIGALAHGSIVDLTSAYCAHLAQCEDFNAARRMALGTVPPDMIGFLEGGATARTAAEKAIGYVGSRLKDGPKPLGVDGERLTFDRDEVRLLG